MKMIHCNHCMKDVNYEVSSEVIADDELKDQANDYVDVELQVNIECIECGSILQYRIIKTEIVLT